jgi:LPS-assembly lipoprotein
MSPDGSSISLSEDRARVAPGGVACGALAGASRRGALVGLAGLLGGCGFRPLYGSQGGVAMGGAEPSVQEQMRSIRVAPIGERFGQLMRRNLLLRLGSGLGGPRQPVYELRAGPGVAAEGVGVQVDGAATRVRYLATVNWVLVRLGPPPEGVMSGQDRAIEAYNIPVDQYFASDSSREAAEARLAATLAEQILMRIATEFRRREAGGAAAPAASEVPPPAPGQLGPGGVGDPASTGILGLPPGSR